ncbi:transport protein [Ceratobasidium sp. AG-Ba]|nr:transport protein [Ceratobasidium sp. AG-Ba]
MLLSAQYMAEKTLPPIGPLLLTVFACILEVFILCFAGWVLARVGILDRKTQKQLNRLNVSLFTPSLLFNKVAFSLSPSKLRELWVIPIFFIAITVASSLVAFVLGVAFRLKRSQRNFAIAASAFQNSNSLPIALMQSLVITVHELKWGKGDTKDAMLGRALTYLVLYSTLGMMLRWSYGVHLLAQADEETITANDNVTETSPLLNQQDEDATLHGSPDATLPRTKSRLSVTFDSTADESMSPRSSPSASLSQLPPQPPNMVNTSSNLKVPTERDFIKPRPARRTTAHTFYSFPATPARSHENLASPAVSDDTDSANSQDEPLTDDEWGTRPLLPRTSTAPTSSRFYSLVRRARRRVVKFFKALNEFMTIPMYAAVASLIVACVQPMQHALENHMQPVKGALMNAGACSIPVTLIVLGAYFYRPKEELAGAADAGDRRVSTASTSTLVGSLRNGLQLRSLLQKSDAPSQYPGETKTVFIAVLSRMVITPMVLLPLMAVFTTYDPHALFSDPIFVVSIVLLISSPPALTLAQITQAASGDAFERLISRTIFWAYCIFTPPLTIVFVVLGLILSKL